MGKKTISFLLCLLFCCTIIYAGGRGDAGGSRRLTAGLVHAVDHNFTTNTRTFAERVAEVTNGAIRIEVFPAGQLGEERDITAALTEGSIDFCINANGEFAKRVPEFGICDAPYVFKSPDHMARVVMSSIFMPLHDRLRNEFGIRILGSLYVGSRHITTGGRQIRTPADLVGFRIRVPDQQPAINAFRMLGANPTPIPFGELYLALQQGLADGQENSFGNIIGPKVHEVQDYLFLTGHIIQNNYLTISQRTFQSLSSDHQQVMLREGERICKEGSDQMLRLEATDQRRFLENHMRIIDVDVSAFQRVAQNNLQGSGFDPAWYMRIQGFN